MQMGGSFLLYQYDICSAGNMCVCVHNNIAVVWFSSFFNINVFYVSFVCNFIWANNSKGSRINYFVFHIILLPNLVGLKWKSTFV